VTKKKTTSTTVSNGSNGRNEKGQFVKGNRGGPGNPAVRRLASYRRALENAISVQDIEKILKLLTEKALNGDSFAMKEVLDRTLGKTKPIQNAETASLRLPKIKTVDDLVKASNSLLEGFSEGDIDVATLNTLINVFEQVRRSLETHDLAARLEAAEAALEKMKNGF